MTKKNKLAKIKPLIECDSMYDEELGTGNLNCVFVFNQNTNKLIGHYYAISKQKQD